MRKKHFFSVYYFLFFHSVVISWMLTEGEVYWASETQYRAFSHHGEATIQEKYAWNWSREDTENEGWCCKGPYQSYSVWVWEDYRTQIFRLKTEVETRLTVCCMNNSKNNLLCCLWIIPPLLYKDLQMFPSYCWVLELLQQWFSVTMSLAVFSFMHLSHKCWLQIILDTL